MTKTFILEIKCKIKASSVHCKHTAGKRSELKWRERSIWSPKTSMTLQFKLEEKTEISWICLHMCERPCQFLLLCSHFKLVLKYLQCRTFQKSFSFAETLQEAGRRDVCMQLSDGLKSLGEVGDSNRFFFYFLACLHNGWKKKKYPNTVPIPKGTPGNSNTRSRTYGRERKLRPKEFSVAWNPGSLGV